MKQLALSEPPSKPELCGPAADDVVRMFHVESRDPLRAPLVYAHGETPASATSNARARDPRGPKSDAVASAFHDRGRSR
jgi:hypothetical protein